MANTIALKTMGHQEEGEVGAAMYPGEAVELQADGFYDPMVSAQAAALKRNLQVAIEDGGQGKTVNDVYVVGERVFFLSLIVGDHVNALVKSGENIAVGDKLVVEGGTSGLFIEAAGTETKFQLEALESSGGALAANTLIACRVI